MKVVVTGGSGLAGYHVVEELTQHGYKVLNVDVVPPKKPLSPYKLVDLQDIGQVYGCLKGAGAVVHLAAIPRPTFHTNEVVFRTNVMATFNLLEAAASLGIRQVVYASSISVLGYPFYYRFFEPEYVPIDEDHPSQPQDPYALSKYLGEEITKAFVRSHGMAVISLRIAWIHTPETFKAQLAPLWEDPQGGASNLWLYVDGRDVGQACRLALESGLEGHQPFYITASNSFMKTPTIELVKAFYPHAHIRPGLSGNQSLISTEKAKRVLGYQPAYRWEDYFEGSEIR